MLIKLTGVPHPDLHGDQAPPVFVDASRVLLVCAGHVEHSKLEVVKQRKDFISKMWVAAEALHEKVHAYIPNMTDPVALEWMQTVRAGCSEMSEAYRAINRVGPDAYHPRVNCTEVQLACGTALEHGVMLTRVWVSESPEEVYEAVRSAALNETVRRLSAGFHDR